MNGWRMVSIRWDQGHLPFHCSIFYRLIWPFTIDLILSWVYHLKLHESWHGKCPLGPVPLTVCLWWTPTREGIFKEFLWVHESDTKNNQWSQMLFDGWWHRPRFKGQATHICIHNWSLLLSSLVAWEWPEGPKTSHQEGDERWRGEKENRKGNN